jgi:hypothetical protein
MILALPRVPAALFAASFIFPLYYTVLSFVLHVRRPLRLQP